MLDVPAAHVVQCGARQGMLPVLVWLAVCVDVPECDALDVPVEVGEVVVAAVDVNVETLDCDALVEEVAVDVAGGMEEAVCAPDCVALIEPVPLLVEDAVEEEEPVAEGERVSVVLELAVLVWLGLDGPVDEGDDMPVDDADAEEDGDTDPVSEGGARTQTPPVETNTLSPTTATPAPPSAEVVVSHCSCCCCCSTRRPSLTSTYPSSQESHAVMEPAEQAAQLAATQGHAPVERSAGHTSQSSTLQVGQGAA